MKKIIALTLCLSIICCMLVGCGEGAKTPTGENPSNELSPTQEAALKENKDILEILRERSSEVNVGSYRHKMVALDKVDNYYRFEKGEIEEFYTMYPHSGAIVKTKDGYYAWGANRIGQITTKEDEIIRRSFYNSFNNIHNDSYDHVYKENLGCIYFGSNINMDITKGVVKYFVPEEVETLKLTSGSKMLAGLTHDGRICLWGDATDIVSTAEGIKYIEHEDKIVDVVRKTGAVYYLTSKGEIYANERAFGQNEYPTKEIYDEFFKISKDLDIESICNGSHNQLAVKDKKGNYYIYSYKDGEWQFIKIDLPEKIIKVESAFEITFFLSESGTVYGYGKNGAQFYEGDEYREVKMEKLDLGFKVKDMFKDQISSLVLNFSIVQL